MKTIKPILAVLLCAFNPTFLLGQTPDRPTISNTVFTLPDGETVTYGLAVPTGDGPHPMILALHPGGARTAYYGSSFMRGIVLPALHNWNAVIVAPDAPTRSWATEVSEQRVSALIENVMHRFPIDRRRILVTGFSLGGRGTWFFASQRPDLFTGAIPIAGATGDDLPENLSRIPIHIIHSQDDEVVPYGPTAETIRTLKSRGYNIVSTELDGIGHFTMSAYIDPLRRAGEWMMKQWKRD